MYMILVFKQVYCDSDIWENDGTMGRAGSDTKLPVDRLMRQDHGIRWVGWMELAQDSVQWRALILTALNLGVLLPQC